MAIPYILPRSGREVRLDGDALVDVQTGEPLVPVVDDVPRFVTAEEDYAHSFGWQWTKWDLLSASESAQEAKAKLLARRTRFTDAELDGKSLLECGCGRGDDTTILLRYPLAEIHSFDLSTAVDAASKAVRDPRLRFAQASIHEIPFRDGSFDVVFCHRVLQHTPDPVASLRAVCRMVKPGGLLFAHSYKRSWRHLSQYKYKYRPLTKRMDHDRLAAVLDRHANWLFRINEMTRNSNRAIRFALSNVVPFERLDSYGELERDQMIELAKLVTFDALTPTFDRPMTMKTFRATIESEGFVVEWVDEARHAPIYGRARRRE